MPTEHIILILSTFSPILPIWIGRKSRGLLWWYSWACLLADAIFLSAKDSGIDLYWAYNFFVLTEFVLVSSFFTQALFINRKRILGYAVIIALGSYFVVHTVINSVQKFNYTDAALLYGTFLVFCIMGLYKVITEIEFVRIEQSPLFVFSIAILILASGSFIILLFEVEVIKTNREIIRSLWKLLHNPLNIIKNILIGYGLHLLNKRK